MKYENWHAYENWHGYVLFRFVLMGEVIDLIREVVRLEVARRKQVKEQKAALERMLASLPSSLNPEPTPVAVSGQWLKAKKSTIEKLRFGSLLRDIEPHVDCAPVRGYNSHGEYVILARGPGIKGWLHTNCRPVVYKTAMHYKIMADRMRRACGLPKDVPLEWIFPDQAGLDAERSKLTKANLAAARAKFVALMEGCRFLLNLTEKLDIVLRIRHWKQAKPRKPFSPSAQLAFDQRNTRSLLATVGAKMDLACERWHRSTRLRLIAGFKEFVEQLQESLQ
jgi:hypothetical protein